MGKKNEFANFWLLAGKSLSGEASDKENKNLNHLLETNNDFSETFSFLSENWNKIEHFKEFEQINVEEDWLILKAKIEKIKKSEVKSTRLYKTILPYAAAALIFLTTSVFLLWQNHKPDNSVPQYTHIISPHGSKTNLILPDGTSIWLNAGSSIKFNNNFNKDNREINLVGEAFFDVSKQDIPFNVTVPGIIFNVLGTSFNIKAYPDENYIETTLVKGSLKILKGTEDKIKFKEFEMKPNQKAVFWKEYGTLTVEKNQDQKGKIRKSDIPVPVPRIEKITLSQKQNVEEEIGWIDGILVVNSEPLEDLVRKLERIYDVEFVFKDLELEEYRYTGRLKELTIEQVMRALKLTSPIDFTIEEKKVFISINPSSKSKYNQFTQK